MNFELQPNLENELVSIRPLTEQDFESLYQVAKDPLIWEQHPSPDRYKRDKFEVFFRSSIESRGALLIIDKEINEVIGSSRFKKLDTVKTAIEIGWTFLSRKYWGGMYNKSVKHLMIDYAFNFFYDIIFYVAASNIRSQRAVEKIGGKRTTDSKYQSLTKKNHLTYRINKKEWKKVSW